MPPPESIERKKIIETKLSETDQSTTSVNGVRKKSSGNKEHCGHGEGNNEGKKSSVIDHTSNTFGENEKGKQKDTGNEHHISLITDGEN